MNLESVNLLVTTEIQSSHMQWVRLRITNLSVITGSRSSVVQHVNVWVSGSFGHAMRFAPLSFSESVFESVNHLIMAEIRSSLVQQVRYFVSMNLFIVTDKVKNTFQLHSLMSCICVWLNTDSAVYRRVSVIPTSAETGSINQTLYTLQSGIKSITTGHGNIRCTHQIHCMCTLKIRLIIDKNSDSTTTDLDSQWTELTNSMRLDSDKPIYTSYSVQ